MTPPILLVEDNANDEALTLRAFKRCRVANEVIVARDGEEALHYLFGTGPYQGRPPLVPQVILLDLNLPVLDGIEVLRRIRSTESTRLLPVIILTSSIEERDLIEGYRLGANSYVRKPVDFAQFADAVQTLGLYWLILNQTPPPNVRPL